METESAIERFISRELLRGDSGAPLEPHASLISTGILDSLALLKLILFIEEHFGIKVQDGDVIPGNFETIERITAFIQRNKREAKP